MITAIIFILLGVLLLYLGAETLVSGASALAKRFNISPLVFGVTVVSIATSLPEALTSFMAQLYGNKADISLGNAVGSNTANIGLILGLSALFFPLPIKKQVRDQESWLVLTMTLILLVIMLFGEITRLEGGILLLCFIAYLLLQWRSAKKDRLDSEEKPLETSKHGSLKLVLGVLSLIVGAYFLVDGAVDFSRILGISERVIAVSVVAIGTSCPELFTSLVAAWKKEPDLALGNILGSNFFNLSFIVGGSALIHPLNFSRVLLTWDMPLLLAFTLLLCYILQVKPKVGRLSAFLMLVMYVLYMTSLIWG